MQTDSTITGLLDAIDGLLPVTDPRHAAVVLAATVRALSAGIEFHNLVSHDAPEEPDEVDKYASIDLEDYR